VRLVLAVLLAAVVVVPAVRADAADEDRWWPGEREAPDVQINGDWIPVVGDFGGGPDDDIIWYAPGTRGEKLWISNGDATFTKSDLSQSVDGSYYSVTGNFGGDARDDIFWFQGLGRPNVVWIAEGPSGHFRSVFYSISGSYLPVVMPNTTGRDSIVFVINSGSGNDPVWTFTGSDGAVNRSKLPDSGAPAYQLPGDFNGDGYGDFFQYGSGAYPDVLSLGHADHSFTTTYPNVSGNDYEPLVADVDPDGDGRDDIIWYNAAPTNRPLPDPIWHGNADGTFRTTFAAMPDNGFALMASTPDHFVEITEVPVQLSGGVMTRGDYIWYADDAGEHKVSTFNQRVFVTTTSLAILGSFTNQTPDIYRYIPGRYDEVLYTR
jgi:hypothetical protein